MGKLGDSFAIAGTVFSEVMVAQEAGEEESVQPIYSQLREFLASR